METPPPFDRAEQAHRLERFLRWTLPLVAVFLVGELSLGIAFGDPPLRALSGVLALFGGAALLAFWLVRRGDLVASTALLAGAILVAAIASAVIQPALLPGLTIVPLLAFAVAALFLHGRALVVTAVGCWVGATLLALVALLSRRPPRFRGGCWTC